MRRHIRTTLLALGVLAASTVGLAACGTHVRPYQRESLANIEQQLDRAPETRSYESHMWMVREGALGGTGKPGGGCGCN